LEWYDVIYEIPQLLVDYKTISVLVANK
jgi:hypothetical protein